MHWFHKFVLSWNSTCFGQFICPSSGVYSLYTQQWYISYRFVDSCRAKPGWNFSFFLVLLERYLLENNHSVGTIESITDVLYTTNKGRLLDTVERFYIYKETCINNQINDKNTAKPNTIFEKIIREDTSRAHTIGLTTYPSWNSSVL